MEECRNAPQFWKLGSELAQDAERFCLEMEEETPNSDVAAAVRWPQRSLLHQIGVFAAAFSCKGGWCLRYLSLVFRIILCVQICGQRREDQRIQALQRLLFLSFVPSGSHCGTYWPNVIA
uniref:Uncharacterized protein n=1 Tax=Spironucleus salmonicida TaxID=348837 RepID=V6LQ25_9EUKA|eukprot:EST46348.1 Hypothetical protein SS50377_13661 [Spironucleus salmonicida]